MAGCTACSTGKQWKTAKKCAQNLLKSCRIWYAIVNVADLEAAFNAGDVVDTEALKAKGLVKKTLDGVKVLGNGELTKALTVKAAAYSASAKEKIEKAGGKAEVM